MKRSILSHIRESRFMKPMALLVFAFTLSLTVKAGVPDYVSVPAGTAIQFQVSQGISTKGQRHQEGERVALTALADVYVNGKIIIRGGANAEGIIREYKRQRGVGKAGHIKIELSTVKAVDGSTILLSPTVLYNDGQDRKGLALGLGLGLGLLVFTPLLGCLGIKGKPAVIQSGYTVTGTTLSSVVVKVQ